METDRPLGIQDIINLEHPDAVSAPPGWDDCWYWCRKHERAEHAATPTWILAQGDIVPVCIRIGPFMTEREATRLDGQGTTVHGTSLKLTVPLGMGVEQ